MVVDMILKYRTFGVQGADVTVNFQSGDFLIAECQRNLNAEAPQCLDPERN